MSIATFCQHDAFLEALLTQGIPDVIAVKVDMTLHASVGCAAAMASYRPKRVAEQIQEEISGLLLKGLKDPRIGFVTITGVKLSPDFSKAKVFFCTTGSEAERDTSQEGLQSAAGFIRKILGKRLHLKTIPELLFQYDSSLDEGDKIEKILSEVREKEGWDDPTSTQGSAQEVAQVLLYEKRFLVTSHLNPDGDAMGSSLATFRILEKLGKDVTVFNKDGVPHNFKFLPDSAEMKTSLEGLEPFDATIVLDCSELERTGIDLPKEHLGRIVGIDHHLTAEPLGREYYLNPKASSIGEMLFDVINETSVELDEKLATQIYTSILTDTGSFHYSNTTPRALHVAAEMVAAGVSPWNVALEVYESQPIERISLLSKVLPTLELDPSGRYGTIVITRDMLESSGAEDEHIDGFINYPRGVQGVEVAVQFREVDPEKFKVSFRSRGKINVASIAEKFGGGGHVNAAGCTLSGPLEQVREKIGQAVEQAIDETPEN